MGRNRNEEIDTMNIAKRFLNLLFSNKVTGVLLLVLAIAMAVATFIENDYNTETAKALIYNAKWFEILILLLGANFVGNIYKYHLLSWQKAPIFLFHFAFIIIILGAGVTRYRGYEALINIREGESNDEMISVDNYLQVQANNGIITKNFISNPILMSELGANKLKEDIEVGNSQIKIQLKKFIPRAKYVLENVQSGNTHLHLVISKDQERKDFYVTQGTREIIHGIAISFDSENTLADDIVIKKENNQWQIKYPKTTDYFDMIANKSGSYPVDSLIPLQFKVLNNSNGTSFVFNEIVENTEKKLISTERNSDKKNEESAVVLELSSENKTKEITLIGGPGYVNSPLSTYINGIHLRLRYGSKIIKLPFSLYLSDFTLERYPGSDSPSAFYSNLEIKDNTSSFEYTIFMNNVLNYKGYRFFQSAYTPDELGTILSVNHDYWGTLITYIGYAMLGAGMLCSLLWKSTHFGTILTAIKQKN